MRRALALVFATSPALADPPDPSATEAGDANLEPIAHRRGMSFTFATGGGLTVGFGIANSVGGGGALSVRLAQVASPHSLVTIELAGVVLQHKEQVKVIDPETMEETKVIEEDINEDTNLLFGVQLYLNKSVWIRGAAGFGVYRARDVPIGVDPADPMMKPLFGDIELRGPACAFGFGVDLFRFESWGFGIELMSIGMANRDGLLSSTGFMLNTSWE